MDISQAGPCPAGIEEFIDTARAGTGQPRRRTIKREVRQLKCGQIVLLEHEDGDTRMVGDSVSLAEAGELANALVQFGDDKMPAALLKLALAVMTLAPPAGRAS